VFEYVEKFGIKPLSIKSNKVLRLLRQMGKLFETESFKWKSNTKKISKSGIVEAIEIVVNKHFDTPLETHNYLKKVMVGVSEKEAKEKNMRAEKEMRKREARGQKSEIGDRRSKGEMTAGEFKQKRNIENLADQIKGIE